MNCFWRGREYIKTQLQLMPAGSYQGALDVVRQTVQKNGIAGMYRGLSSLIAFSPASVAVRYSAFDLAKRQVGPRYPEIEGRSLDFVCGMFSGVAEATLVLVPMETLAVIMMHDQMLPKPRYNNALGPIADLGPAGLYKGFLPQLAKTAISTGIRFGAYSMLKERVLHGRPEWEFTSMDALGCGAQFCGPSEDTQMLHT